MPQLLVNSVTAWLPSLGVKLNLPTCCEADVIELFAFGSTITADAAFRLKSVRAHGTYDADLVLLKKIAEAIAKMRVYCAKLRNSRRGGEDEVDLEKGILFDFHKAVKDFEKVKAAPGKYEIDKIGQAASDLIELGTRLMDGSSGGVGYSVLLSRWVLQLMQSQLEHLEALDKELKPAATGLPSDAHERVTSWCV